ncbi:hypothetical protein BLS_001474 [Venturia inaequalis]|uniref:MARVEL domain-containing protein n=1 Tax=Venturia inaequalis TaxID=5025 RepID=A0A8H3VPW8_VENIN|nr:hypothetical protein BLS_001474 [Venturia inaequalis]KAE9982777.1 hypothetical protein EG328_010641 [Venturia inaequalis]KAE9994367.1 hypothetical protein EG327_010807 [Venturia inaequalis]RDI78781.1 hypothetical protein Vi05172_g11158 [Venturia inaequalis]
MFSAKAGHSAGSVPKAFLPLRIIQLLLGLVLLGLSAYHVVAFLKNGAATPNHARPGLFTGVITLLFTLFWLLATCLNGGHIYKSWAMFAFELLVLTMWLYTFVLLACMVSILAPVRAAFSGSTKGFSRTMYAALAVSVINSILFAITSALYLINLIKHRKTLAAEQAQNVGHAEQGGNVAMQPVYQ